MDEPRKCPKCGGTHIEEHGTEPGDFNWWMCRDCGTCFDHEKRDEGNTDHR